MATAMNQARLTIANPMLGSFVPARRAFVSVPSSSHIVKKWRSTLVVACTTPEKSRSMGRSGYNVAPPANTTKEPDAKPIRYDQTVRIYSKASEELSLTIRNGEVVLAMANSCDEYQHWIKDMRYGGGVKDEKGNISFALINKATGQALKHSFGHKHPVRLVNFKAEYLDESILWTEDDVGEGFRRIAMLNNAELNFDACDGVAYDGTPLILFRWNKGVNQRWKIAAHDKPPVRGAAHHPVRFFCLDNQNLNLAIRDGKAILADPNPNDETQQWIKDYSKSGMVCDEEGRPTFAVVNKATGQAIKPTWQVIEERGYNVQLVPYHEQSKVDITLLWTEGKYKESGFRHIRMASDTNMCLNGLHGSIRDGSLLVIWPAEEAANSQWKVAPFAPST